MWDRLSAQTGRDMNGVAVQSSDVEASVHRMHDIEDSGYWRSRVAGHDQSSVSQTSEVETKVESVCATSDEANVLACQTQTVAESSGHKANVVSGKEVPASQADSEL